MRSLYRSCLSLLLISLLSISLMQAQDLQGEVFVEATVSNSTPFVGQQIIYSFKLYDAVGLIDPQYQPSDFEGFWRIDIGVVSQTSEQINGRQYTVTTLSTALYPTHSGLTSIQPSSVVLPETVFRSKQTLTANPISLDVKSLPETTTSGFNGAVGQFTMLATLDRQTVKIGEPITMTLTVSGTGNVEQLHAPTVPNNWRATINAGNFESEFQNGFLIGTREYQIVFIPTSGGTQELPPITLEYFDPVGENFNSISTSPIQIQVTGDNLSVPNAPLDAIEPSLQLKPIDDLAPQDANPLLMIIAAILPICGVGFIGYQQRLKARKAQLQEKLRRQQALQVALQGLKTISLADPKVSYQQIDNLFKGYVADKLNMRLDALKQSDPLQLLVVNKVSGETLTKVQSFILEIEEGIFSPKVDAISAERHQNIIKRLSEIDAEWIVQ